MRGRNLAKTQISELMSNGAALKRYIWMKEAQDISQMFMFQNRASVRTCWTTNCTIRRVPFICVLQMFAPLVLGHLQWMALTRFSVYVE
jgi:hypothetical protein